MNPVPRIRLLCLVCAIAAIGVAHAADVLIRDLDVNAAEPGDTILVPVEVRGLVPSEFMAFQFEFSYDPAALTCTGVARGALISTQDAAHAFSPYAPYLWGLEHSVANGTIRVAGAIVLEGVRADYGNLNRFSLARVPSSEGQLLQLQFTLLQKARSTISLVSPVSRSLLGRDPLAEEGGGALTDAALQRAAGGPWLTGLPNWWQLGYFDATGVAEDADPDGDGAVNRGEYESNTDPTIPDVRLRLEPGWNLVSLPITPGDAAIGAVMAAVNSEPLDGASGGAREQQSVHAGMIWRWDTGLAGGRYTAVRDMEPFVGYWVYVPEGAYQYVSGTIPGRNALALQRGWNLIGPQREIPPTSVEGQSLPCVGWNAVTLTYQNRSLLAPACGYWLYCRRVPTTIDLGAGAAGAK